MKTGLQVISILIMSVFLAQTAFSGPFQKKPQHAGGEVQAATRIRQLVQEAETGLIQPVR